jgi:hypothetical protein
VSLSGKSGLQTFLTFESDPVRSKPYPHDHSSRQIRQPVVQRVCQFPSAHANGKSLKVKDDEETAGDTLLERPFVRDDLDVSVKTSPRAADQPDSWIRGQNVFFPLKTGWMADFPGKPH